MRSLIKIKSSYMESPLLLKSLFLLLFIINTALASTSINLIMVNNNGIFRWENNKSISRAVSLLSKKHSIKILPAANTTAMIWGKAIKVSNNTLKELSELSNSNNILIAQEYNKYTVWSAYINGNNYYWKTNNLSLNDLQDSILMARNHMKAESSYLIINFKIITQHQQWQKQKAKLYKLCKNSSWMISEATKSSITFTGLVQDKNCIRTLEGKII